MTDNASSRRTIYLSRSERWIGGRRFLRFSGLNGVGISFLGESTVALLAIHFGGGNLVLGLIAAMIHISGIALLIVPRLFRGRNVVTVGFWAWMARGLVNLPYAALLFIEGRSAVALIVVLYALFCLSRTAGIAMVTTVQKRLTVSRTQGEVIFRNATSFHGTTIVSRLISSMVLSLRYLSDLTGLLVLQVLGIISNTLAAYQLKRIPNRTRVEDYSGENLFVILVRNMKKRQNRRILILRWISLAQLILFAMAVPFLRRSAGLDPSQVFLYSIAAALAAFLSSLSLRGAADRAGSRPLLFYGAVPAGVLFCIWAVIPAGLSLGVYAIAGFGGMFFINAVNLGANRLLIGITPDNGAVGFNAMETFVTSISALIIGFGAGYLADVSLLLAPGIPINDYGLVFLPAAAGSIVQAILVLKVDEPGSMGIRESFRMLRNIDNLRIWQTISTLEATADPVKRKTLVHSVGSSRAPAAASEIGRILSEPLSSEKGELIDALFFTRRPELADFLCDEALDAAAFHRERAIFALGAYPGKGTSGVLRGLLNDPDTRIQAAAAKSLGRIGDNSEMERVYRRWKECGSLMEHLDYMIALFHMDPERRYIGDLFSSVMTSRGERSERTLYTLLANQYGLIPPLGALYREEGARKGGGLDLLLEESRDTPFMLESGGEIVRLWQDGGFEAVWRGCHSALERSEPPEVLGPMVQGLRGFPVNEADSANALAGLYFTYQVLTAEAES